VQIEEGADPARVVRDIKAKLASAYGIAHSTVEIDWEHERRACALEAGGRHEHHHPDHGHRHDHDHRHDLDHDPEDPPLRIRPA
jgi:cobalt-zinc-cadmium efflux system protein